MKLTRIDGLPVIDATKPISITVNKRDINGADAKEPANCAVARACRREFRAREVRVHLSRIYVKSNEGNWVRYETPTAMRNEIIAFDRGGRFEQGSFVLQHPHPSIRLGASKQSQDKKYVATGKRKRSAPHILTNVRAGPAA